MSEQMIGMLVSIINIDMHVYHITKVDILSCMFKLVQIVSYISYHISFRDVLAVDEVCGHVFKFIS